MDNVYRQTAGRRRAVRATVWVAVLGVLLGLVASLLTATGADAHASLESVSPADGAELSKAPTKVVLTFDEPVSTSFATVSVTAGSGGSVGSGKAKVDGAMVTQALKPGLTSGSYTVAFRVVSDDGHPVSDKSTFTLTLAAAATPSSTSSSSSSAAPRPTSHAQAAPRNNAAVGGSGSQGGLPAWAWIAIAAAILVVGGGTAAGLARRRGEPR
jgi:methionine-rich copper-binding protein CopC